MMVLTLPRYPDAFRGSRMVPLGRPAEATSPNPITPGAATETYSQIPTNFVVTAEYTSAACGGEIDNTYVVAPATNNAAMCSQATRTPAGYVVTAIFNSGTCGTAQGYGNTYVIDIPKANMAVCSQASGTLTGWVVTSVYNSGTCDVYNSVGNTLRHCSSREQHGHLQRREPSAGGLEVPEYLQLLRLRTLAQHGQRIGDLLVATSSLARRPRKDRRARRQSVSESYQ
jgi:hypothetical protein